MCFNEIIRVLLYLGITKVFLGCHKDVTQVHQWSDMQECHIRSDMSRATSKDLQVQSEKSRVTSQELQLKIVMSRVTSCNSFIKTCQ